ncbi:MAG: 3-phosphoshikimate 1-carboxyvinyltransferase [Thermodesulfobacteriota bacterium]
MKEITPARFVDATVSVPGSKSITQRALIAAALADGVSSLHGPLASEDTAHLVTALRAFGVAIEQEPQLWRVHGQGGRLTAPAEAIYLGNNGTATRFLTSVAALSSGTVTITGDERMAQRPIGPLLRALAGWGVDIRSLRGTGCPPLEIRAQGLAGGRTVLPAGRSSQYLSSLLLVAPCARTASELVVEGEVLSRPYVAMTCAVMAQFGVQVQAGPAFDLFRIEPASYRAQDYCIEGDASSASYFWAAAAVSGGRVTVANVPEPSLQGDAAFTRLLARMGCRVMHEGRGVTVFGPPVLRGIDVDMGDWPDVVPTLAVVAARARGRTVIRNVAHLRIKESDRLHAMAVELGKLGVRVEELPDGLVIEGSAGGATPLAGATIETYNDHRIAMSFAVASLFVPGVRITGDACVAKSFPDFWSRFEEACRE